VIADVPALPLHEAGKYVAAAYIVVFVLVLVYIAVMALRVGRIERELTQLSQRHDEAGAARERPSEAEAQR
jgi:CcmD family protein